MGELVSFTDEPCRGCIYTTSPRDDARFYAISTAIGSCRIAWTTSVVVTGMDGADAASHLARDKILDIELTVTERHQSSLARLLRHVVASLIGDGHIESCGHILHSIEIMSLHHFEFVVVAYAQHLDTLCS